MTDTFIGYAIIGIGIIVVLGVVFVIASRGGPATPRPKPPRGVHLPAPSALPVLFSAAAALMGAGLVFRGEDQVANLWLLVPGLVLFVATIVLWVRAADHEWIEVERGPHDDGPAH
jgi:hypothetical protein